MPSHEGPSFGKPPPAPNLRKTRGDVPPGPPVRVPRPPEAEARRERDPSGPPEPPRAAPAAVQEHVWSREYVLILAGITLVAGFLRLYRIDAWSFWIDEGHTYRDVLLSWDEFWQTKLAGYPLSYLVLRAVMFVLPGSGEGSLRLPFAFFGIASVPLLGFMVRPMLGHVPALLGSTMLALSPWHIYWSQNCRFYSLVLFLGLASAGLFYVGLERGNLFFCFLSLVAGALAALSHPSATLIFPAFVLYLLAIRWLPNPPKGYRRGIVVPVLVVLAVSSVLAWILFTPHFSDQQRFKAAFSVPHLISTSAYYIRLPVIVTALAGGLWLAHAKSRPGVFLVLLLAVPFLELTVISTWTKATAQYLFYTLPAFCALAGLGAHVITQRLHASGFGAHLIRFLPLAIILLDMMSYDYLYYFNMYGDRPRWREASQFVRERLSDPDVVLTVNGPSVEYYLNPGATRLQAGNLKSAIEITPWDLNGDNPERRQLLRYFAETRQPGNVWILLTEPEFDEMDRGGLQWSQYVRDHWHLVKSFRNWSGPRDMTVHVYRRRPEGG